MAESWRSRLLRWRLSLIPAWRGTGARLRYLAHDYREARLEIPLTRRTRNYVGTIFGGSMYAAVDPIYMLMLIFTLGPGYVVWDKAATIRFRRPGRSTLSATFRLEQAELDAIRSALEEADRVDRTYRVDLIDTAGEVCATVEKVVQVRRRPPA